MDTGSGLAEPAESTAIPPSRELADEHLLVSTVVAAMQRVAAEFARIESEETGPGARDRYRALAEEIATAVETVTATE